MAKAKFTKEELKKHIEAMEKAQEEFCFARDRVNELRQHARAEGLNIFALNPLIAIIGETNHHARGVVVLRDFIEYAQAADLDLGLTETSPKVEQTPPKIESTTPDVAPVLPQEPAASKWSPRAKVWIRTSWDVTLALGVSAGLLLLLN